MNRETYMRILRAQLAGRMPVSDMEDILRFYEEYFEDAGQDRESSVINELGFPERLARQILGERATEGLTAAADAAYQGRRTPDYTPKLGGKLPGWAFVLLAILVFAIATPLWGGLLGGLGLAGLICVGVGFGVVIGSFTKLTLAAGLYQAGGGLMAFAIGSLLLLAVVVLVWLIVKGVRYLWNELVERGEQA